MNEKEAYNKMISEIKVPRELIQDTREKVAQEKTRRIKRHSFKMKPAFALACVLLMVVAIRFMPSQNHPGPSPNPSPDSSMTGPSESKAPSAKIAINVFGQVEEKVIIDDTSFKIKIDDVWYKVDQHTSYINPYGSEDIKRDIQIGNYVEGFTQDDKYLDYIYKNDIE